MQGNSSEHSDPTPPPFREGVAEEGVVGGTFLWPNQRGLHLEIDKQTARWIETGEGQPGTSKWVSDER